MKGRIRQELERDAARTGILFAGSVSRFGVMRTTNPCSNATGLAKGSGRAVSSPHRAGVSRVVWNFCRGVLVRGSRCPRSGGHAPRGTHTTCALDQALSGHRFFFAAQSAGFRVEIPRAIRPRFACEGDPRHGALNRRHASTERHQWSWVVAVARERRGWAEGRGILRHRTLSSTATIVGIKGETCHD